MTKNLVLLAGPLSELCIENSEENFVSSDGADIAASVISISSAAAGLAHAAADSLAVAVGGTDSIQSFTGVIDGKRVSGRFSKIGFKDGDRLECAVDPLPNGTCVVYAARRPSDQTIWMFPHCSRGSKKHWKYAWKMCMTLAISLAVIMVIFLMPIFGFAFWKNEESYFFVAIFGTMGAVMGAYFPLNTARRWAPFVMLAESIFAAYGYPDPAQVDMPQQDRAFWKNPNVADAAEDFTPWVFRYLK